MTFPIKDKPKVAEGWACPTGSALRHYIREQKSLCDMWRHAGDISADASTVAKCEVCVTLHRGP